MHHVLRAPVESLDFTQVLEISQKDVDFGLMRELEEPGVGMG